MNEADDTVTGKLQESPPQEEPSVLDEIDTIKTNLTQLIAEAKENNTEVRSSSAIMRALLNQLSSGRNLDRIDREAKANEIKLDLEKKMADIVVRISRVEDKADAVYEATNHVKERFDQVHSRIDEIGR